MELFLHTPFFYLTEFRTLLQSTDLHWVWSFEHTSSVFQTKSVYSVGERYFHSFHYISAWAETSLYQFQRVGLSASWLSASWFVGELSSYRSAWSDDASSFYLTALHQWCNYGFPRPGPEAIKCAPAQSFDVGITPTVRFSVKSTLKYRRIRGDMGNGPV